MAIAKLGRVFGLRWAACSSRSCKAVWKSYPALYQHLHSNNERGMVKYLENENFFRNLALVADILHELGLLSTALEKRNVTIQQADKLIYRSIKKLDYMKENKCDYEIPICINLRLSAIPRQKLLDVLVKALRARMFKLDLVNVGLSHNDLLFPEKWPEYVPEAPWIHGEQKLKQPTKILKFHIATNIFRDFVDCHSSAHNFPDFIKRARRIVSVLDFAVSSAEAERGFSTMNLIAKKKKEIDLAWKQSITL